MQPLKGQEELFEAIYARDDIKAWNLVKYAGYREVESMGKRKLIFIQAFNKFDPEKNNNFITYYLGKLHIASLQEWKRSIYPITSDKRALKQHIEHELWPDETNSEPVNQNSNILRKFRY
jgi:hypothetical protein